MTKYLIAFLFLLGCMNGTKVMSADSFSEVSVGMSVDQLTKELGEPYAIKTINSTDQEYEYIEKISANNRVIEERHYFFLIKNGQVYSKRMKSFQRPVYQGNAYELQTTFNGEEEK